MFEKWKIILEHYWYYILTAKLAAIIKEKWCDKLAACSVFSGVQHELWGIFISMSTLHHYHTDHFTTLFMHYREIKKGTMQTLITKRSSSLLVKPWKPFSVSYFRTTILFETHLTGVKEVGVGGIVLVKVDMKSVSPIEEIFPNKPENCWLMWFAPEMTEKCAIWVTGGGIDKYPRPPASNCSFSSRDHDKELTNRTKVLSAWVTLCEF